MAEGELFATDDPPAPDTTGVYVRVAVERAIDQHATLTYAADELAMVGDRVEVPLGRGNTQTRGVIVDVGGPELLDGYDPKRVKRVLSRDAAGMPDSLVKLARWTARYYACPLGVTLATMVPGSVKAGTGLRSTKVIAASPEIAPGSEVEAKLTPSMRVAWTSLATESHLLPCNAKRLAHQLGLSNAGPINRLVSLGLLVEQDETHIRTRGAWTDRQAALPSHSSTSTPSMTPAQARAIDSITQSTGTHHTFLLHGITGSGKTEVYLHAISHAIDQGRGAIVLVPEISLTPQTASRFLERFGSTTVAVMHSGLTATERHDAWRRLQSGEARVVVGARSAIFAPIENLGIIVVDEEHDASYKQDQAPRYHARDLAVVRGSLERCPVVLGSATPSLETWHNASASKFTLLSLPERVAGGTLPRVDLVDIREERKLRPRDHRQHAIGPTLEHAIERTLTSGGQAVLLINRRGFAGHIGCPDQNCGWSLGCESCSVRMVLHKDRSVTRGQYVRCHHCHAESLMPDKCPDCKGPVRILGAGTQRLEDEIEQKFGSLDLGSFGSGLLRDETFARVDADTMRSSKDYFRVLDRFGKGELRLLLGTQMIAKGLDFPNVRLVGVVDADTGLALPDFRATERTFQLVSQVAGRAGRSNQPGRVIVQTLDTEAPALVYAARHDYTGFATEEVSLREACNLPPAWRLARVVARDKTAHKAKDRVREIAETLQKYEGDSLRIDGPMECILAKLSDHHRFAVEIYAKDSSILRGVIDELVTNNLVRSDATMAVDVDPVSLL